METLNIDGKKAYEMLVEALVYDIGEVPKVFKNVFELLEHIKEESDRLLAYQIPDAPKFDSGENICEIERYKKYMYEKSEKEDHAERLQYVYRKIDEIKDFEIFKLSSELEFYSYIEYDFFKNYAINFFQQLLVIDIGGNFVDITFFFDGEDFDFSAENKNKGLIKNAYDISWEKVKKLLLEITSTF